MVMRRVMTSAYWKVCRWGVPPMISSTQNTWEMKSRLHSCFAAQAALSAYSALSFTSSILPHAPLPEPEHLTYTPTITSSPSFTATPSITGVSHTL